MSLLPVTDPQILLTGGTIRAAWTDGKGQENGDNCANFFGKPLGYTNSDPDYGPFSAYNTVINGDKYYIQSGFSNKAKAAGGSGCINTAFGSTAQTARRSNDDAAATEIGATAINSSESDLAADGLSTATITVTVTDSNGDPVAGDAVHLQASEANQGELDAPGTTQTDTGTCGTISTSGDTLNDEFTTNADGQVFATYTSSTDDIACDILATETAGGTANDTVIYQGTADQTSPSINQSAPTSFAVGAAPVTFTATSQNPAGGQELDNTQDSVFFSGDDTASSGLDASQVTLSYEDDFTNGQYVPITLTGTTQDGGYIEGDIDPDSVLDFPANSSETVTFKVSFASGAADSVATGSPLTIESQFNQLNESDGATTNLDYDDADAFVTPSTPPTTTVTTTTTTPGTTVTTPGATVTSPGTTLAPVNNTYTVVEPTKTVVETIAAKPTTCTVPNLSGKNVAGVEAAVKKAKCASVTLVEPTTKKGQSLVFFSASPRRGAKLSPGHTLKVTFRIKKAVVKKKPATKKK